MDKSELKNNLFNYATKELSQDAFICWLCSFALDGANDSDIELTKCAHGLICEFMRKGVKPDIDCSEVHLKEIKKQFEHIDVLLTVEYKDVIYKIIVEDKIHSSEHDNQLSNYRDHFSKEDCIVIGIYYKTGFQSDLSEVEKAGYKFFGRNDILDILDKCNSDNDILKAYREYWKSFKKIAQSYKDYPLEEWPDWQTVNGFYDEMKSVLEDAGHWAGYNWVSNKSGGFWGLWYGNEEFQTIEIDDLKAELYLQIETSWDDNDNRYKSSICLKLENKNDASGEKIRRLRQYIVDSQSDFGFERPRRLGYGQYMTVGNYMSSFDDYESFKRSIFESIDSFKKLFNHVYNNRKSIMQ